MPNDQPDYVSPTAQVQRILGSVTAGAGATVSTSFPVPTECQQLGLRIDGNAPNLTPASMSLKGDQSNDFIMQFASVALGLHLDHRPITDTSVTLSVTAPAGGPSKVTLLSFTSHPAVSVENLPDNPLTVKFTLGSVFLQTGAGISIVTAADASNRTRLGVYEPTPEPWQAPASSFGSASAGFSVAAGGTQVVIAGSFGLTITINRIKRFANASASVNVWEDTGSAETVWTDVHTNGGSDGIEGGGLTLPVSSGLQFRNLNATATGTIWATVHYTQK